MVELLSCCTNIFRALHYQRNINFEVIQPISSIREEVFPSQTRPGSLWSVDIVVKILQFAQKILQNLFGSTKYFKTVK